MKIGLLYELDGLANATRAYEIKNYLLKHGYNVELIDLCKEKYEPKYFYRKAKLRNFLSGKGWNYTYLAENIKLRANIIEKKIKNYQFDAVICGSARNAYVLTKEINCLKIFDCPAPWTSELKQNKNDFLLTDNDINALAEFELEIYKKSDYVAFHWEAYTYYIKKNIYNGNNLIKLNWGCHPQKIRTKYNYPYKIVYIGNLSNNWVDIPLLKKLVKLNNSIDTYGLPKPIDEEIKLLNYKGYAPTLDVLLEYQLGLVTINKNDKLHCEGFSAKYLDYISYGLPVLEPEWRNVPGLSEKSIFYNEENFIEQINKYSDKKIWQEKSDEVYELAKNLDWDITLQPLLKILK